jgi:hypothetical protein
MKYVILALALVLSGCTSDSDKELSQTKRDLRDTKDDLYACQSRLEMYSRSGSNNSSTTTEEVSSEPAEPQYETVEYYQFTSKSDKGTCLEREESACGLTFTECKDGYAYRCMTDVKYKVIEEQKLVE